MWKEVTLFSFGFIAGLISMYYILKPNIGNKYTIDADIKNKKGNMSDNIFKGTMAIKEPKKQRLKRLKNRIFTKKKNK